LTTRPQVRPGAAGAVALVAAWNPVVNRMLPPAWYVPANLLVAAALLGLARASGAGAGDLGLDPSTARSGLRLGLRGAALVAAGIGVGLGLPATRQLFADERLAGVSGAGLAYQTLVRIPFGTVVLEEVAFRGVLLGLFARRSGTARAVVASSALFGVWHVLPTLDALEANDLAAGTPARVAAVGGAVVLTGVVGALFCALRLRSGSLVAPAVVHLATNSLGALAAGAALSGS
jgi:membrane protease YdiL (CAAX protease family)